MTTKQKFLISVGAVAIVSTTVGYAIARHNSFDADVIVEAKHGLQNPTQIAAGPTTEKIEIASRVDKSSGTRYTCPMHPNVVLDHPGNCPICGMTLVKMADDAKVAQSEFIHVSAQTQAQMGVRLEPATVAEIHRTVPAYATIAADESKTISVNPKVEGWIKTLNVQGSGQAVHKGQVLYTIYSTDLQQRQRDYIDLLARRDALSGNNMDLGGPNAAMLGSVAKERFRIRDRLLAADVPVDVLEQIEANRRVQDVVPVRATQDGIVSTIGAREGSYVNPSQTVLTYADTNRVWAEITLFPDQLAWVHNGDRIVLTSGIDHNLRTQGRIDLSAAQIDPVSHTARLHIPIANTQGAFRPGAYADVSIETAGRRALTVPRDAVIRTGHGDFVVVGSDGQFRTVGVKLGVDDEHKFEILAGLTIENSVAVNGQFLLDSASSIQSMQNRIASGAAAQPGATQSTVPNSAPGTAPATPMDHMHNMPGMHISALPGVRLS